MPCKTILVHCGNGNSVARRLNERAIVERHSKAGTRRFSMARKRLRRLGCVLIGISSPTTRPERAPVSIRSGSCGTKRERSILDTQDETYV